MWLLVINEVVQLFWTTRVGFPIALHTQVDVLLEYAYASK